MAQTITQAQAPWHELLTPGAHGPRFRRARHVRQEEALRGPNHNPGAGTLARAAYTWCSCTAVQAGIVYACGKKRSRQADTLNASCGWQAVSASGARSACAPSMARCAVVYSTPFCRISRPGVAAAAWYASTASFSIAGPVVAAMLRTRNRHLTESGRRNVGQLRWCAKQISGRFHSVQRCQAPSCQL